MKWFPSVKSDEGIREAYKAGIFGALGFSATVMLGVVYFLFAHKMPGGVVESGSDFVYSIIGIGLELFLGLYCAYRFWRKQGLYIGVITTVVFALEIYTKVSNAIASGKPNAGWWLFYAAIIAALLNGVRAAWALKRRVIAIEPN